MNKKEDAEKASVLALSQTEKAFKDQGFTAEKYALKVIEGTDAVKGYRVVRGKEIALPDYPTILKYLQEYAKVTDKYPAAKHKHEHSLRDMTDDEINRKLAELQGKAKKGESPEEG